jgi:hypothetical protein
MLEEPVRTFLIIELVDQRDWSSSVRWTRWPTAR